jgi:hypothetical protein
MQMSGAIAETSSDADAIIVWGRTGSALVKRTG